MNEQDSGGFGIGDALASLALILGGGAAGRKMAGRTAVPTKKELSALTQAMKTSGTKAMNTPLASHVATAQQSARALYQQAYGKIPTKAELSAFMDGLKNMGRTPTPAVPTAPMQTSPQMSLDLPVPKQPRRVPQGIPAERQMSLDLPTPGAVPEIKQPRLQYVTQQSPKGPKKSTSELESQKLLDLLNPF